MGTGLYVVWASMLTAAPSAPPSPATAQGSSGIVAEVQPPSANAIMVRTRPVRYFVAHGDNKIELGLEEVAVLVDDAELGAQLAWQNQAFSIAALGVVPIAAPLMFGLVARMASPERGRLHDASEIAIPAGTAVLLAGIPLALAAGLGVYWWAEPAREQYFRPTGPAGLVAGCHEVALVAREKSTAEMVASWAVAGWESLSVEYGLACGERYVPITVRAAAEILGRKQLEEDLGLHAPEVPLRRFHLFRSRLREPTANDLAADWTLAIGTAVSMAVMPGLVVAPVLNSGLATMVGVGRDRVQRDIGLAPGQRVVLRAGPPKKKPTPLAPPSTDRGLPAPAPIR